MGSYLQEATLKNPAFQFYPGDFLADPKVQVMSCEEIGAYLLLLLWQWAEGSVPDNLADAIPAGRASRSRVKSMLARLDPCFPVGEDGKRRNRKLERVRGERAEFSEQQSGRAKSRWRKEKAQTDLAMPGHQSGIANALPELCRNDAAPHCPTDAGPQCSSSSSSFLREPSVLSSKPPDHDTEPTSRSIHGQLLGAVVTNAAGVTDFTVETDLGAGVAPTQDWWLHLRSPLALSPAAGFDPATLPLIRALIPTTIPVTAAGEIQADVNYGSGGNSLIKRMVIFSSILTSLRIKRDALDIFEAVAGALNSYIELDYGRVAQTNMYVWDPLMDGDQSDAYPTRRPNGTPANYQFLFT